MSKASTIEENFTKLEEIIEKMESEDVTLETSFGLYSKGLKLIKDCNDKIDKVEKEMKVIEGGSEDE